MLSAGRYETIIASSGEEALAIASRLDRLDLLITDVVMPGICGDELAARIRQRMPDVPVLYLTGQTNRLFDARSALWQQEAFLEKPATPRALVEAISLLRSGRICAIPAEPQRRLATRTPARWAAAADSPGDAAACCGR